VEYLIALAFGLFPVLGHFNDPAYDHLRLDETDRRRFSCERMTQARAHELHPGRVPEPGPRTGALNQGYAFVCVPRELPIDFRAPREEAILSNLSTTIAALTESAVAAVPNAHWTVDAFYPDRVMTAKLATAARTRLAERGAHVTNGVPLLAAGDLLVMRTMTIDKKFPVACRRFHDEGSLGPDDAFLAIVLVDSRETDLHAGICVNGNWRWLQ
jgi:hypothetical protein